MDDASRLARMISCFGEFNGRMAATSPGGRLLALDGVSAGVMPVAPGRSMFNSVIYADAAALEDALPALADTYAQAGVHAWTVWVPEADTEVKAMLAAAGHRFDAQPRAMVLDLSDLVAADAGGFEAERTEDAACFADTAAAGFGFEPAPLGGVPATGAHCYVARVDGAPAGTVAAFDHAGDCGIYWVATVQAARGRGVCRGLMTRALLDARERGCATSSLQATAIGAPVYADLGYRDLGAIEMWERREAP